MGKQHNPFAAGLPWQCGCMVAHDGPTRDMIRKTNPADVTVCPDCNTPRPTS